MNAAANESAPDRYQVNLPALYAQINEQRQAGGLSLVEPAIMAVRSTIKFSIRRGRTLRLRGDAIDADREDVEALCAVLSDLFNVQVQPAAEQDGGTVRVLGLARSPVWALPMSRLYDAINGIRGEKGLPAVESAVISVRTRVRYSVVRSKPLNFKDDRLIVDDQDREFLDNFIASHFNVELPGGVAALCIDPPTAESRPAAAAEARAAAKRRSSALAQRGEARLPVAAGQALELSLPRLYDSINRLRQEKGLQTVEPAVISVRTRVRYSIVRRRPLDFKGERLQVDDEDRDFLDIFITQHFDVSIPGGIAALCEANAATRMAVAAEEPLRKSEPSSVWRYLSDLLRRARFGPLTRIDVAAVAAAIALRMHGLPSETRTDEVRERLMQLLTHDVGVEAGEERGVLWMSRAQMQEAVRLIRRDFPIQLGTLRELLP